MRVLVLGGTGYIGRHLCQVLHRRGIAATVISRHPDTGFLRDCAPSIDILPLADLLAGKPDPRLAEADVLIHLAHGSIPATSHEHLDQELAANLEPVEAVGCILAATKARCHVVYVSSGGQIYGHGHDRPIPETAPPRPATTYALGKLLVEETMEFLGRTRNMDLTILRVANPVGRWQIGARLGLAAAAVHAAVEQRTMTVFGAGHNLRDYFDVDDLAMLLADFADPARRHAGVYNIGAGVGHSERDVIAAVERVMGATLAVDWLPARSFDLPYAVVDPAKAVKTFGWPSGIDLDALIGKLWSAATNRAAAGQSAKTPT